MTKIGPQKAPCSRANTPRLLGCESIYEHVGSRLAYTACASATFCLYLTDMEAEAVCVAATWRHLATRHPFWETGGAGVTSKVTRVWPKNICSTFQWSLSPKRSLKGGKKNQNSENGWKVFISFFFFVEPQQFSFLFFNSKGKKGEKYHRAFFFLQSPSNSLLRDIKLFLFSPHFIPTLFNLSCALRSFNLRVHLRQPWSLL